MPLEKLLTIDSSFVLTGLGVLVRDAEPAAPLHRYGLHTTLPVVLVFADGRHENMTASVEEITRPSPTDDQPLRPEHALLLHLTAPLALLPGTEVWLAEQPTTEWL